MTVDFLCFHLYTKTHHHTSLHFYFNSVTIHNATMDTTKEHQQGQSQTNTQDGAESNYTPGIPSEM